MMKQFSKFASVILDVAIDKTLDYGISDELLPIVKKGLRVEVPVRGHLRAGYILAIKDTPDFTPVKPIANVVSTVELLPPNLFELAVWMARYYCTPLRQVLKIMIPSSIRTFTQTKQQLYVRRNKTREELQDYCIAIRNKFPQQAEVLDLMLQVTKGILLTQLLEQSGGTRSPVDSLAKKGYLKLESVKTDQSPLSDEEYLLTKAKILNPDQANALVKIKSSINEKRYETHLLFGVTGSGKTEVYLQAIEQTLAMGKTAIMLVPEISLTPQTVERFRSRFKEPISILHHRLSNGERCEEWQRILKGETQIIIGARSAIFSPTPRLGLIIVDEEHETAYKQTDEMPTYHARDIAVMRGKMAQATVILGSATPSLESYYNAQQGKYTLSKLTQRANPNALPQIKIVDMRHECAKASGYTSFSEILLNGIKNRIASGEQTILFLNRRGYHAALLCTGCQTAISCPHCSTTLTFHKNDQQLNCHLCGYAIPPPKQCPECKSPDPMKYRGVGTELIEKSLHAIFPDIRTLRIDADTTKHKGSHEQLFRAFATGKADLLIGTQMVTKGLHFPQVTLVGVLNCDPSLNIPDFRASETGFQLITQVAGRAGRGATAGEVILQTFMPENQTLKQASQQDYESFYQEEIAVRQLFRYPPHQPMVKILVTGSDNYLTNETANQFRSSLLPNLSPLYEVQPVSPAGHAKINDRYRYHFFIRGPSVLAINQAIAAVQQNLTLSKDLKVQIDINPTSTFF